jgi:hypothetical protein
MRRARLSVVLGVALVFAVLGAVVSATEPSEAARSPVIDRTFRCAVSPRAGVREVHIYGQAGVRDQGDPSKWFALPHMGFYSSSDPSVSMVIRAGKPVPSAVPGRPGFLDWRSKTLAMGADSCRPVSVRVALSPKGLGGGAASQLLERFECVAPRRVLVRVRGEFRAPTTLFRGATATPLKSGYIAIRSESGKPLVYAAVFESGKARLFMAPHCVRD